jgi:hypothetical protein
MAVGPVHHRGHGQARGPGGCVQGHSAISSGTPKGQSIKEYVLGRALGDAPALDGMSEDEAFMALANFLEPRIEQARRGELSGKSVDEILREERKRAGV